MFCVFARRYVYKLRSSTPDWCSSRKFVLSPHKYSKHGGSNVFSGVPDRYKGITVDSTLEKCDNLHFLSRLEDSINKWQGEGVRCVWFRVNIQDAHCVPALAERGFSFHHARDNFVMMYKWLPKDSKPNLPPTMHTNLGVGAMVFNNKSQILAISEKHYEYPHWKLPGGYVERSENIVDAAKREVKEETGVESEFLSLITFRHSHNMMFGNSDIYVLLMMQAVTEKITPSITEIKDCKWMAISEYLRHPHVHEFNRLVANKALQYRNNKLKLDIQKKTVKWATYEREMNIMMLEECDYT